MKPLTDSAHYRSFIASRDRALEAILQKYLRAMGQTVSFLRKRTEEVVSHLASHPASHADFKRRRQDLERRLDPFFHMATAQAQYLVQQLRRTTYTLSYAGQAEAISRVLQKKFHYTFNRKDFDEIKNDKSHHGHDPAAQVDLAYSRLLRDVLDAFQMSQVRGDNQADTVERVMGAFPREIDDAKPSRRMAPMKEAAAFLPLGKFRKFGGTFSTDTPPQGPDDAPKAAELSTGTIEKDEWTGILDDYYSEYFPGDSYLRSPYGKIFDTEDGARYAWQLEQDVSEDFVSQVRDGENEAANDQGITDMQWIAVLDNKTDDCCAWRDGLTTSEIEKKLDDQDDDCDDALAPPLHPLCRCRLAPMTDDFPETAQADFGSFDNWLETQADKASAA